MEIPDAAEVVGFAIRTRHENAVENECVVASAADQAVSAPAAAENIVAVARNEEIIPGPAEKCIVTVADVDDHARYAGDGHVDVLSSDRLAVGDRDRHVIVVVA